MTVSSKCSRDAKFSILMQFLEQFSSFFYMDIQYIWTLKTETQNTYKVHFGMDFSTHANNDPNSLLVS